MTKTLPAALPFVKMHGHGNDFVVIDARGRADPVTPQIARAVGDRHRGVGFDQLIVLSDSDASDIDARIAFWNADGSTAGACGNGARCAADLVMRDSGAETAVLLSETARLDCQRLESGLIRVNMGRPRLGWKQIPLADASDTIRVDVKLGPIDDPALWGPGAVNMGNPHAVFFVEDAETAPVEKLGPMIEHHPMFPERTNVEFAQVVDRSTLRVRVWERGVGVTQACGSGACAAVVAGARRGLSDRRAVVMMDGGPLAAEWSDSDDCVYLTGPTRRVFDGALTPEFLAEAAEAGAEAPEAEQHVERQEA